MTAFPTRCIRGIPNDDFVTANGHIASHLFYFVENPDRARDDRLESSINWEDDPNAIAFTLNQVRDGKVQFRYGLATIPTSQLDHIKGLPAIRALLDYERAPRDDNAYHGNLLCSPPPAVETKVMKQIAATIATAVDSVVQRDR